MTTRELIQKIREPNNWTDDFFAEIEQLYFENFNTVRNSLVSDGSWDRFDTAFSEWRKAGQVAAVEGEKRCKLTTVQSGAIVPISQNQSINLDDMEQVEESDAEWLIPGYIPKYQITSLAGDGGAGKTTIWCSLAAAISSGQQPFILGDAIPFKNEASTVMYFSAEDSISITLKRKLRKNNAILKNIKTMDIADDRFARIKFNDPFLESLIAKHRPDLCIFDPIQAFIPPEIRMGDRNHMRNCLAPLIGFGEKYGTTFLIILHANKQSGVWGRKRMADSSDIWDISRSVLMVGETSESGIRYISQEKSNYGPLEKTILYRIEDEVPIFQSFTTKRDREFVSEHTHAVHQMPQRDEAKEFILDFLRDGEKEVADLDGMAKAMGISQNALKNAKTELKKEKKIRTWSVGYGASKKWVICLLDDQGLTAS